MPAYRNSQWIVDESGVSTDPSTDPLVPLYDFELKRVTETTHRGNQTFYDWPVHLAWKEWVDIRLFNDAFEYALRLHAKIAGGIVDEEMLRLSKLEALRINVRLTRHV